jgi:hypothetical protein
LITVYKKMRNDQKVAEVREEAGLHLAESLKSVKTEWAYEIKKELEAEVPKK